MATESAINPEGCHPYSVGADQCLVHNGSFSNHATIRRELRAPGRTFDSENDSEVGARFVAACLAEGDDLEKALLRLGETFDGFYTLLVTTADGFAVVRDEIACKPAVIAEHPRWVAMASEFRALADLPGHRRGPRSSSPTRQGLRMAALSRAEAEHRSPVGLDLPTTTVRALNAELHAPTAPSYEVLHPQGAHSIGAGIHDEIDVDVRGHAGYFCAGHEPARAGRRRRLGGNGVAENMMSGSVRVRGDASQSAGATGRGGLLVIEGSASMRCGISMKGIDIVVGGDPSAR